MKNPEVELKLPVIPDIELTATKTAEVISKHMSLSEEKKLYPKLKKPFELYYCQYSWANENDRNDTKNLLGLKKFNILQNCKHFTFLENPKKISEILSKQ